MNGLALRISRGGDNKTKKSIGLSPVKIPVSFFENSDPQHELFKNFADAASTDEQLAILKKIVDQYKNVSNIDVIKLLAIVFLEADAKHPVKCFISRYITKNSHIQDSFSSTLANQISTQILIVPSYYKQYINVVSKVATCIENFNAGVTAVRLVEIELARYLKDCLEFCVELLSKAKTLSPTEKNEIFNISHLALRLLLHIIQKASDDSLIKLNPLFNMIRSCIQELMFDNDVPMDTKSVCGILYLSMHILENGPNSWIDVLSPSSSHQFLLPFMETDASQLCLYSAIATVVSAEKLQTECVNGSLAILDLMHKILEIGDRSSLESTLILGVTRTVFQMSKYLYKTSDKATGLSMVESLLTFAWAHLEHHMDSVRHLTAQMLDIVVTYCGHLDREGDDAALSQLLAAVRALPPARKSRYVGATSLLRALGARRVLRAWPALARRVLAALGAQHVQASATTTLEVLVEKLAKSCSTEQLHEQWLRVVVEHVREHALDCTVLNILENLLVKAVRLDPQLLKYIIPYIKGSSEPSSKAADLRCVLMLLSVTSKSGVSSQLSASNDGDEWKGVIGYDVLRQAAIDAVDETRILSLSLIVESPKSTEEFTAGDLEFVLWYLKYNINAQAPNFRQLTLSCMKKFMKRYEDSYKVIKRQREPNAVNDRVDIYLRFLDKFRQQCFASLLPGANYSRRGVALQLLVWCQRLQMEGYTGAWSPDDVEKLLLHLEDSYEENKRLALEVLGGCPLDLLKNNTYSISIDLKDIFTQASSLKPTDCASAAHKLDFLRRRLPECILQNEKCSAAEPVTYSLVTKLLARLRDELGVCERSVVLAARNGPMYGVLHCITHMMATVDAAAISSDPLWTSLVSDVIAACVAVNAAVASVVNNSSPEGHLPMDLTGLLVTDEGNSGGVVLGDGRQVSAQMVLLCAWRSVKEVSLLLGLISSRLSIAGEDSAEGNVSVAQLTHIGEHFTTLLAETKHRGAFEQAYVGFSKLLARLWRCRNPELHSLPPSWLAELTQAIASGEKKQSLCATRRSAGLPFMIQALVTTELQVQGNPKCFHSCMSSLLSVARSSACVESRSHALNILRALFRNAALDESVAPYVGRGLVVALEGFEGDTWAAKLQEVSSSENKELLRPSLYPVLLLLGRLYPSSLEGTVSNLKLAPFLEQARAAGAARELHVRALAAAAVVPLVAPDLYISHIQSMFALLRPTARIKHNYRHGILLQLARLLDARPRTLGEGDLEPLHFFYLEDTLWLLSQAVDARPCYLIADEYTKVINLIAWRFPSLMREDFIPRILLRLDTIIFHNPAQITTGRAIFLSNAIYLNFILRNSDVEKSCDLVIKGLLHSSYEVVLSVLKYLLILHDSLHEDMCKFQERLTSIANREVLDTLKKNNQYIPLLCKQMKSQYLECQQKSLKILVLEGDTQRFIIEAKIERHLNLSETVIDHLLECLRNEHENLTHVYLESLLNFVTNKLKDYSLCAKVMLDIIRVVFKYSSSDNSEITRSVVVRFVERNIKELLDLNSDGFSEGQKFELKATIWCIIITLLEDDEAPLRQRMADAVTSHHATPRVSPSACAGDVRDRLERDGDSGALFALIALLDFKSVVVTDDGNDECRVFDQNERYNIFLEETVWTSACAHKILSWHYSPAPTACHHVLSVLDNPVYKGAFDNLCSDNVVLFKKMVNGDTILRNDALNPKIQLFVDILRR